MSLPAHWSRYMGDLIARAGLRPALHREGTLQRLTGLALEAVGLPVPVGSQCVVQMKGMPAVPAEVVGFSGDRTYLMPAGVLQGLASGARVYPSPSCASLPRLWADTGSAAAAGAGNGMLRLPIGAGLLGRVVDARGVPMDPMGPLHDVQSLPIAAQAINAMDRDPIRQPLDTGVRAINSMLTIGRGQRIGLFAGSGVGKSVLLGMMARYTEADVIVVGLIGERGREVKEFIEEILGEDGRARSVVVAAPADAPPLIRMQGANYATAIAEHFRDKGQHVLLLMDSLTRYAMAQREIALAIGEPPATKGYPPSCFAKLPGLVERSGNGLNGVGSITAIYTVLSEGDDQQDPIADTARAILDGHIVLTRSLAEGGHYPAIDIEQSVSRVMHNVVTPEHLEAARQCKRMYSRFQRSRDLIQLGAYVPGQDGELDQAVGAFPVIEKLLQQNLREQTSMAASLQGLTALVVQARANARTNQQNL
jgi:flagellum-specific ATP synthase